MQESVFFDEWNSSLWNGIGTYRDILLPLLTDISEKVTLVSLNSDMDSPKVIYRKGYDEISIPLRWCGLWRRNGASIASILSEVIVDGGDNVFMLNHTPCAEFIIELRKKFPYTRFVFTVHDMGWCSALMGEATFLKEIMIDGILPSIVSSRTARIVSNSCEREKDIFDLVDAIVCLSPSTALVLESVYGIPKEKIFMIPNAFKL